MRDVAAASGVDWLDGTRGVLLVDLDNDGDQDLVCGSIGFVVFAENDGSGRFTIRELAETSDDTVSLTAADYDSDGDVDVFVCVYFKDGDPADPQDRTFVGGGGFVFHDANDGGQNNLLRNEGGWRFSDVTEAVGLDVDNRRYSFAAAWEDYDNDGDQDLYVANDFGRNCLYRNEGGAFTNVAPEAEVEDRASGMSVAWGDYDRDGWMDLYVSNMYSSAGGRIAFQERFKPGAGDVKRHLQRFARGNTLFHNSGDGSFDDVSLETDVTMGRWAWSSNFVDLNADGWEDLVVANGYITTEDTDDL